MRVVENADAAELRYHRMMSGPAATLDPVDPLELAFDSAPWDEHPATEEEIEAIREARAAEAAGTARFVPGAEVSASIAERASVEQ